MRRTQNYHEIAYIFFDDARKAAFEIIDAVILRFTAKIARDAVEVVARYTVCDGVFYHVPLQGVRSVVFTEPVIGAAVNIGDFIIINRKE